MAAVSILDCPVEILEQLIECLPCSDLHAVSLVAKGLRLIAEPFLYRKIDWLWAFRYPVRTPHPCPMNLKVPPIRAFLRTITKRPELAGLVKEVALRGDNISRNTRFYMGDHPSLPVMGFDVSDMTAVVEAMNISYRDTWIRELHHGKMDAYVALLISLTPNLERLYLGENFLRDSQLVRAVIESTVFPSSQGLLPTTILHNLSEADLMLSLDCRYRMRSYNTTDALSLFYLPSIQHISVSIDNPSSFAWPNPKPPIASTLQSLNLTMIRETNLGKILSATKNLKKLQWDWCYMEELNDAWMTRVLDLSEILASLSRVKNTLTDLKITSQAIIDSFDDGLEIRGSFTGLSEFDSLQKLEVPAIFLSASLVSGAIVELKESLPRNLNALTLSDPLIYSQEETDWAQGELFDNIIWDWLRDWRAHTPHLRHFCLHLYSSRLFDWGWSQERSLEAFSSSLELKVEILERRFDCNGKHDTGEPCRCFFDERIDPAKELS
jgi:hypothetical protein